jgi:hypothetical protein
MRLNGLAFGLMAFLLCMVSEDGFSQQTLKGEVRDAETGETLPFVHIAAIGAIKYGGVSNIEGHFSIGIPASAKGSDSIGFSCVGYERLRTTLADLQASPRVSMRRKSLEISEVVILAEEDPAYEIIRRTVENRKLNDPEKLPHFQYKSYNKASVDIERVEEIQKELDSTGFAQAHLFMIESATKMAYRQPGNWSETVVASKISGIKNPVFSMLSNSFQPFSVYTNQLNIVSFDFLNPISPNSRQKYIFELVDTVYVQGEACYLITFQPRSKASGNLMKGSLTIGFDQLAIVNFRGENTGDYSLVRFEIRQAYRKFGSSWFPEESKTFYRFEIDNSPGGMLINSTTYNSEIDLQSAPPKDLFSVVQVSQADSAGSVSDQTWTELRPFELDYFEENTYAVYDTIPKEFTDATSWVMNNSNSLMRGRIPIKKIDVVLMDVLRFNGYEGFRLGLGLATNRHLINWMSLEGYYAYGFRDKRIKYGGGMRFFVNPKREFEIALNYKNDVDEPGRGITNRDNSFLRAGETFRNFIISRMNPVEQYIGAVTYRPFRGMRTRTYFLHEIRSSERRNVTWIDAPVPGPNYTTSEIGMDLTYIPREKLIHVANNLTPLNIAYPRFRFNIATAIPDLLDADQEYTRAEFEFSHQFNLGSLNATQIFGGAAKVWGQGVAYPYLRFGRGAAFDAEVNVLTTGYFQTMLPYDFLTDAQVHAGLVQHVGNLFGIEKKWTKPELKLAYQATIGELSSANAADVPFGFRQLDRAFLEAGVIVDNILRTTNSFYYSGFGAGLFYRHGHFADSNESKNLSFILSFAIGL